jgi:hypothetical protein
MTTTNPDNYTWEVIYKGDVLGTTNTAGRQALIKENLTFDQIDSLVPGDIDFRLVDLGEPDELKA